MKRVLGGVLGAIAAVSVAAPVYADNSMSGGTMSHGNMMNSSMMGSHAMMGKKVTLTGTVVDLSCYIGSGLHGPGHVGCAKACILNGQEMGIQLPSGQILAVFGKGPNDAPNKRLIPFVESRVKVTGEEFTGGGITGIRIDTIEHAMMNQVNHM